MPNIFDIFADIRNSRSGSGRGFFGQRSPFVGGVQREETPMQRGVRSFGRGVSDITEQVVGGLGKDIDIARQTIRDKGVFRGVPSLFQDLTRESVRGAGRGIVSALSGTAQLGMKATPESDRIPGRFGEITPKEKDTTLRKLEAIRKLDEMERSITESKVLAADPESFGGNIIGPVIGESALFIGGPAQLGARAAAKTAPKFSGKVGEVANKILEKRGFAVEAASDIALTSTILQGEGGIRPVDTALAVLTSGPLRKAPEATAAGVKAVKEVAEASSEVAKDFVDDVLFEQGMITQRKAARVGGGELDGKKVMRQNIDDISEVTAGDFVFTKNDDYGVVQKISDGVFEVNTSAGVKKYKTSDVSFGERIVFDLPKVTFDQVEAMIKKAVKTGEIESSLSGVKLSPDDIQNIRSSIEFGKGVDKSIDINVESVIEDIEATGKFDVSDVKTSIQNSKSPEKTFKTINKGPKTLEELKKTLPEADLKDVDAVDVKNVPRAHSALTISELDEISTRKIKQTKEAQDFFNYAEQNLQDKDIMDSWLPRHTTLTAERVAEFLDGGINGRVFKEMVDPVYAGRKEITIEGNKLKNDIESFKVLELSKDDIEASLFAQGKIDDASPNAKKIAKFVRDKYDEFLDRLNDKRSKLGVEPIPKRKDYITHLNELNTLSEIFGGVSRLSIKQRISKLKADLLVKHPDWSEARAFDAAKRQVDKSAGLAKYLDARQPAFKFAKERLGEFEENPSIIRSINAYARDAIRYIHQAENVAKIKAYKDALPPQAAEFFRLWNTEQVAGRAPTVFFKDNVKAPLTILRNTLGENIILGNMATTAIQLTSFPQVVAFAGARNTMAGIGTRLMSYLSDSVGKYDFSDMKIVRSLETDIGMGESILDKLIIEAGKATGARNATARARSWINFGRQLAMGLMEVADQFTVGATFEAFYRKAVNDGMIPDEAMKYAEIMTGKTQARYFPEAKSPFLNTFEGKIVGQFGTYAMNQFEMFKRDFGKEFLDGPTFQKSTKKSKARFMKQFTKFVAAAYLVDYVSEEFFGRQPYDVKDLVDEIISYTQGDTTFKEVQYKAADTVLGYIPYLSSVKFGGTPLGSGPVSNFVDTVTDALFGSPSEKKRAWKDLIEKWSFLTLAPFGGNQLRKTFQGLSSVSDIDIVSDPSRDAKGVEKFAMEGISDMEKMKAFLFSPYSTKNAIEYFENKDKKELKRESIRDDINDGDLQSAIRTEGLMRLTGLITPNSTPIKDMLKDKYLVPSVSGIKQSELGDSDLIRSVVKSFEDMEPEERIFFLNSYADSTRTKYETILAKGKFKLTEDKKASMEDLKKLRGKRKVFKSMTQAEKDDFVKKAVKLGKYSLKEIHQALGVTKAKPKKAEPQDKSAAIDAFAESFA